MRIERILETLARARRAVSAFEIRLLKCQTSSHKMAGGPAWAMDTISARVLVIVLGQQRYQLAMILVAC